MLNKIFKKEPIQTDLCGFFRLVDSKPASMTVDCIARNSTTNKLETLVIVTINDIGTSRNGFPEKDVFDGLYALEEKIESIANSNKSKYTGRFITDGKGYYLTYTNQPENLKKKLEKLMNDNRNLTFDVSIKDDKEWKIYYHMLYPSRNEKQRYHNAMLINKIILEGDKPEKERLIDHAVFFNTKEDREKYLKELKRLKFPIEKHELFDNDDKSFTLQISVRSPLELDLLNSSTDILISLAEKHNALYDGWGSEITE